MTLTTRLPEQAPALPDGAVVRGEAAGLASGTVLLDVVVPVYNEVADLERSVRRLHAYLTAHVPYPSRITIADNGSTDGTLAVARRLAGEIDGVVVRQLAAKGRGRALKATWLASDAVVVAYMDVDLSTDLAALVPLVAPLVSGHSDVAVGTRLARSSRVVRGPRRELISRGYNMLLRGTLGARFSDAQCGFKAVRRDVAERLLPMVEDTGWFFDTELLVLAQRAGLRIHEVPVDWVDDPDSRVDVVATALDDLRGILWLLRALTGGRVRLDAVRAEFGRPRRWRPSAGGAGAGQLTGQLARFAAIGVASTAAYLGLYLLLGHRVGAQAANALALLVTALANNAANRRITFGVQGRRDVTRHHVEGVVVFVLGLALTSGALSMVDLLAPGTPRFWQLVALVLANAAATVLKFLLFRSWVFHPRRNRAQCPEGASP